MPPERDTATLDTVSDIFRPADLIGQAGVGSNGQLLADTLNAVMPRGLERVLLQRENLELGRRRETRIDRDEWGDVAKAAGLEGVKLADVSVRGGADEDGNNVDTEAAWITFVYFDDRDDSLKGAIPYLVYKGEEDPDDDEARRPILQSEALAKTPAARDHAEAQAKARAAEDAAQPSGGMPNLAEAKASEIVAYLEEHPEQADAVVAFEKASRGDDARKSILALETEETGGGGGTGSGTGDGSGSGDGAPGGQPDGGTPEDEQLTGEALEKRAAALNIEGRSKMSAPELRDAIAKAEAEADAPPPEG